MVKTSSFAMSVATSIFWGIGVVLVYTLLVTRDLGRDQVSYRLVAAPPIMVLQIMLSALLIRAYHIETKAWAMIAGSGTGFAMPVLLFLLLIAASAKSHAGGHYLVDALAWTMLASAWPLLGVGLLSGIHIGYAAWKRYEPTG